MHVRSRFGKNFCTNLQNKFLKYYPIMKVVEYTDITAYPLVSRGKVRDIYEIDDNTLLIITTDRMSAFDVVLAQPVPYKGVILNKLTLFWMRMFDSIMPNHVLTADIDAFPDSLAPWREELDGRAILARKARPLPVECIVRGYLAGSGWESYQKTGMVCDIKLPAGLKEAERLTPPIFTPTTKAEHGKHDENISLDFMASLTGDEVAKKAKLSALALYEEGRAYAESKGIIIADTKFEFGFIDGVLHLIDEVLTPDSSRFWPEKGYKSGQAQPSYDKQFLRDWLKRQPWNHEPPPPHVPQEIIEETAHKYREAYTSLTGKEDL